MNGLEGLTAGDPVVVYLGGGKFSRRAVARVARAWLTDDQGGRHRIDTGMGINDGTVTVALTAAQHDAARAAAEAARRQNLPEGLAGHAFERSGCRVTDGEPLTAARARGSAAECAADAAECLRQGDTDRAARRLNEAMLYLFRYQKTERS